MAKTAMGSELARPSQIQNTPPRVWRIQRVHSLPLMPNLRPAKSELYPPKGRATRLAMPKVAAMIPAVCSLRLNLLHIKRHIVSSILLLFNLAFCPSFWPLLSYQPACFNIRSG